MEWYKVNRLHADALRRSILARHGENIAADVARLEESGYEYEGASECGSMVLYMFRAAWDGVIVRAASPSQAFAAWDALADRGEVA